MNFSNSTTDKTQRLKDKNALATQWETIDWTQLQKDVNRLQTRIAKATVMGDKNKLKITIIYEIICDEIKILMMITKFCAKI